MRRQRNMSQMKEQNKTPEKELKEMEKSNLLDAELKTVVVRMLNKLSEDFSKEIGNIKVEIENIKKALSLQVSGTSRATDFAVAKFKNHIIHNQS